MQTATHRERLLCCAIFSLYCAVALSWTGVAVAQQTAPPPTGSTAPQVQEIVTDLGQRQAELDELAAKIDQSSDRAAAAILEKQLSERRSKYRRDLARLVELVGPEADAGTDADRGRKAAAALLEADAPKLKERLRAHNEKALGLIEKAAQGTPEEAETARQELISQIPASTRLIKYVDANIDLRKKLGLDVRADAEHFKERIKSRAEFVAAMLSSTKEQIDEIAMRPGVDQDTEAQKELATLRKQRDALAEHQRVNVDLMDEYGLATAPLRRGLISATGKLSQDILDREVAAGLLESSVDDAAEWFRSNGAELVFQLIAFLLILVGFWVLARIARGTVRRLIDRSKLQVSTLAKDFFIKTTGRLVILLGFIIALAQLGVEVAPLLAGLGIAGFIIGFALQDTLSNFASGLMILVYRPFDVGDAIEAAGVTGKVDQMNLVSTMILTFDNQLMIVPNKQVWGGIIRNITHQDKRRVDLTFGIGYSDDIPKAEKVLSEIVAAHDKVLPDPEPVVKLHELGDSAVSFIVRPWAKTDDYWNVYWDITREVKRRFDEEGISIPFPQRDVHVYHENAPAAQSAETDGESS